MPVILVGLIFVFGVICFLRQYDWKHANDLHKFSFVAWTLTFFIVVAPLHGLDQSRIDNTAGMGLVGIAFLIGLVWLGWGIRKRTQTHTGG